MFVRLTHRMRIRAGWLVALLYLLCVVAPGGAMALGAAAPCLPADTSPALHGHGGDHDHGMMHAEHHHPDAGDAGHHHDGKAAPGPCCAMLCVSAMPAELPTIAKPAQPSAIHLASTDRTLPGKAPPLLYRPPIV